MAQQSGNDLKTVMEKLLQAFEDEVDTELPQREKLDHIFRILKANKEKIISEPPEVEKKEKLPELLRSIGDALQQCKARSKQQQQSQSDNHNAKSKKMTMPSVSDCNPFKSRSSQLSVDVDPLLEQTIAILGDVPPPPFPNQDAGEEAVTELYEWTTSFVDESRIYGWEKEADEVVDALVGSGTGVDDEVLFRTAGIAGIHGSGKTALAQKVFVHDRIKDAFPLRLWVCVGPPDSEDRFNLLYRMLDNLGLDTAKVEDIVDKAEVVVKAATPDDKERSKIGVLLFILYVTLYKTGYLIVFDDMRAYSDWYSNLTLQPPKEDEWYERLAYGLPKARKSAVLVTCRSEDHARVMVRTGGVFHPPKLEGEDGWKLFHREYKAAKDKDNKDKGEKEEEDKLYKELQQMQKEIIGKCLGLPVAIVQAAKGFAALDHEPEPEVKDSAAADQTATNKTVPATEV
ncbi:putative disease resistance protein [Hordeum vulgare]|uniref:NB-ARC domain-containing protein n=1 Tax=Hordeum vulgare subsp. vulgare TaxID=112509 RepID=M0V037_HORVV|nr:putative disease resistance protein RGA4 [Hordeum vulgare subsp. vulgare]KAE8766809.1 putative disease resistance protein [Hordeum vulgare]